MNRMAACLALVTLLFSGSAAAQDSARARLNYMLNCQGCHLPDAAGSAGNVPRMKDYVGLFLQVEGGREFLVQVPGSANSSLSDARLAELLNWMLVEFSAAQLPADFQAYGASEIAGLRATPLADVEVVRAALVAQIEARHGAQQQVSTYNTGSRQEKNHEI